jgi:outer membrane protein OmpA-like peptidoglycan-associated protein
MRARPLRSMALAGLVCVLAILVGCVTAEVKSARSALEAARAAGKDKECPAQFQAAEDLVRRAELLCNQCKPGEANALAADAMSKINALCPAKAAPAPPPAPATPPPPPPPAEPAPTVSLTASLSSLDAGACTNLNWSTSNATSVSIDPEVGTVGPSGSKQVCPTTTTRYTLSASGPGGSRSDSTTITVKAKPTDKLTIHVNFDTNKSAIRKADVADLNKAEAFVRKYSTCKIEIDGYTDSTGNDKINNPLSERRAEAVKKWLIDHGAGSGDTITTQGFGSAKPIASNKTAKGRFENRRAEILAFCQ